MPECPSTNTFAGELAQAGQAPEGTVVITHHQTSGRGQRGNSWESGSGLNLTFSVVVYPVFLNAVQQFHLNKAVALAIHDVVCRHTAGTVKVKWPNDIMISNKKVCGILIENQLSGSQLSRAIIGIGLNVNQETFAVPTASSLSIHSGKSIDLAKLFDDLLQSLEWRYLQLKNNRLKELDDDYIRSLFWLNERKTFMVGERKMEGVIKGVDENGKLVVEIEGERRGFDLKEIKYLN
ncbi:MAG TPA: biotin--[acetyl-CoA-carboxylase] ligase [Cyclobacteriaceae bacterium]|nr:biotin--[acetyl-CoA-carboxylase] ligase [Cyclobacteriaceae bacterium]